MAFQSVLTKERDRWILKPVGEAKSRQGYERSYPDKMTALERSKEFIEGWNGDVSTAGRIGLMVIHKGDGGVARPWWATGHRMARVKRMTPGEVTRPSRRRAIFDGDDYKWVFERRRENGYQTVDAFDTKQEAVDYARDQQSRRFIRKVSVYGTDGSKTNELIHTTERRHG